MFAFVIPLLSGQWCLEFLFTKKGRDLEGLPPTQDALKLQVKRARYQRVYIWGQATIAKPVLPDPTD